MNMPMMPLPRILLTATDAEHDDDKRSFGCMSCTQGMLPLQAMQVNARILGMFAHTTLTQTFVNHFSMPIEATYMFPLPDRAAATSFVMEVAGRRVEGLLQEREQARANYDQAMEQGKRASIAEEERPGVFSLRVGNLMPGETAIITFTLAGPLVVADSEVTYRFPLVVAPRYMPGALLPGGNVGVGVAHDRDLVPDASRISPPVLLPGFGHPIQLGIEATIDGQGIAISDVRSSLHAVHGNHHSDHGNIVYVRLQPGQSVDADFILRFRVAAKQLQSVATAHVDASGVTGLLSLVPPPLLSAQQPKDVVFVLDKSGSMQGWKMVAAKRALTRMMDALRVEDRFVLIGFDNATTVPDFMRVGLVQATDRHRYRASEWLHKLQASGGTEMRVALVNAAGLLARQGHGRDRVIVFITDGQVGNEADILQALAPQMGDTRFFALGVDTAVNAGFLHRLSALGRGGDAELVESEDRLDEVLQRCHRRIEQPALQGLTLEPVGGTFVDVAPTPLPDVFSGIPATVGFRGTGISHVRVRGRLADGSMYDETIAIRRSAHPAILPTWGRMWVRELEDQIDAGKQTVQHLKARIVEVSLRARVLCRFTAFVAIDNETVNFLGRNIPVVQPVSAPRGMPVQAAPATPAASFGAPVNLHMRARSATTTTDEELDFSAQTRGGMAPPPPAAPARVTMKKEAPRKADTARELEEATRGMEHASFVKAVHEQHQEGSEATPPQRSFRMRVEDLVRGWFALTSTVPQARWHSDLLQLIEDMMAANVSDHELVLLQRALEHATASRWQPAYDDLMAWLHVTTLTT
jgi:Ca-activated chloride channel homolog